MTSPLDHRTGVFVELRYLAYASGNLGKNLLWGAADVSLLFLMTDMLQVAPVTAGVIFLAGLVLNAVLDPIVAMLAARTSARLGRYGLFIVLGAPVCAGAFALVYALPALGVRDIALIALCIMVFRASYSALDLPHNVLIAKVASTSHVRGRIAGYRFFFSSVGGLVLAACAPALLNGDQVGGLAALGAAMATVAALSLIGAWFSVRGDDAGDQNWPRSNWREQARGLLQNRALWPLAGIVFVTGLTAPLFAKASVYYASVVLMDPGAAQLALAALVAGQFVGVVLWTWVAGAGEKAWAMAGAHAVAAAAFLLFGATTTASPWVLASLAGVAGVGLAGIYMLIWSMAPDVADYGEWSTGIGAETAVFAVLILLMKVAIGLGAAFMGLILDIAAYEPGQAAGADLRGGINLLIAWLPAAGCLTCVALALRLRLTHRFHARIARRLERRRQSD